MTRLEQSPMHPLAAIVALAMAFVSVPRVADSAPIAPFDADPDSVLSQALERIEGVPLRLEDALRSALSEATSVRDAEAALRAAEGSVRSEKGAFDPELYGEVTRSNTDTPTASAFAGAPVLMTEETATTVGARVRLPIGTKVDASLETSRLETNDRYESLVPKYDTSGKIEITQPLLKGFGPAARVALSAAERDRDAARARRDDARLAVQADVENAYWDLYAAERDFAAQGLIRDRAEALLSEIRLRADAGLVGPSQVANARVFLTQQEQSLLDQEERLDGVSDRIATLIGSRPASGLPRFRPSDHPPTAFAIEEQDALVARALTASHELRAAERDATSARARVRGARWDALPAVDLFGSLGGNGLSGTGRDVTFGNVTVPNDTRGDFGDTWEQVRNRDFPTWTAGLRVSIPIGLRAGRGERDRLDAEATRAEERAVAARRNVEERVRASHREMLHASRRLEVARDGVDASLDQVQIGTIQYRAGQTTAFELVRLAADLATAQQRYSQALVRAAKAAAALRRLSPSE